MHVSENWNVKSFVSEIIWLLDPSNKINDNSSKCRFNCNLIKPGLIKLIGLLWIIGLSRGSRDAPDVRTHYLCSSKDG